MVARYQECNYVVERKEVVETPSGEKTVEIRECVMLERRGGRRGELANQQRQVLANSIKAARYLSLKMGQTDLLFYYKHGDEEKMNQDWNLLTKNNSVDIKELSYFERILDHDIGIEQDGWITVY